MELEEIIDILRCPLTKQKLRLVSDGELAAIRGRLVVREGGAAPSSVFDKALVTSDGVIYYPVVDGIAQLLPTAALVSS